MVKVETALGVEWFYAGAHDRAEALIMAANAGHEGDQIETKEIPNRFGVQPGEFRFVSVGK